MIRGQNQASLVPVTIFLDPLDNRLECVIARKHSSDRIVNIVVVVRPVDIAGFDT